MVTHFIDLPQLEEPSPHKGSNHRVIQQLIEIDKMDSLLYPFV